MRRSGQTYPNADMPLSSTEDVAARLRTLVDRRQPASLIRLGDGEGMVWTMPTPTDRELWTHLVRAHFGPLVTTEWVHDLARRLRAALEVADIVGVRTDVMNCRLPRSAFLSGTDELVRLSRASFELRSHEVDLPAADLLRLAHTHRMLSEQAFSTEAVFCSAWVHFALSQALVLVELVDREERIGLVTVHEELAPLVRRLLDVDVDVYLSPPMYRSRPEGDRERTDRYLQLCEDLEVRFAGQLFLIGAGVWGKIYCDIVRSRGGIGVDVGAVLDAWLGIATRRGVMRHEFGVPDGSVPASLLLEDQVRRR